MVIALALLAKLAPTITQPASLAYNVTRIAIVVNITVLGMTLSALNVHLASL